MPKWLHDRAHHIMDETRKEGDPVKKSIAYAIATQQSHALGKSPKGYGTPSGKHEAKEKYDEPKKEYVQTADPSQKSKTKTGSAFWAGFSDELRKIAAAATVTTVTKSIRTPKTSLPKLTSKPVIKEQTEPASVMDQLRSSRTIQPPPVTSA